MATFAQIERQRESFRRKWEREFRDTLEDQFTIYMDVWRSTGNKRAARQAVEEPEPMRESYRKFYRAVGTYFAIKQYADLQKLKDAPPRDYWTDKIDDYVRRTGKTKAQAINAYSAELLGAMTSEVSLEVLDDVEYEKLGNDWRDIVITRSERIFQTEVVCASELGKVEAAKYVRDEEGLPTMKRWQANLDAGVREAHYYADGKEAELDEYFTVGGEQLRFPGDTSGGATAKNLINCRCANEYFKGDGVPKPPDAEPEPTSTEDLQREQEKQPKPKPRPQEMQGLKPGDQGWEFVPAKSKGEIKRRIDAFTTVRADDTLTELTLTNHLDGLTLDSLNVLLEILEKDVFARGIRMERVVFMTKDHPQFKRSRGWQSRGNGGGTLGLKKHTFKKGYFDRSIRDDQLYSLEKINDAIDEALSRLPVSEERAYEILDMFDASKFSKIKTPYGTGGSSADAFLEFLKENNLDHIVTDPSGNVEWGNVRAFTSLKHHTENPGWSRDLLTYGDLEAARVLINHEVGHVLDSTTGYQFGKRLNRIVSEMDNVSAYWQVKISEYARTSDPELWAEIYAMYKMGDLDSELYSIVTKLLEEL